jgi:hypothetical protein
MPLTVQRARKLHSLPAQRRVSVIGLTGNDLTLEQAERLRAKAAEMLRYLGALNKRIQQRRFPPNDPLVIAGREAYNAMHTLHVELHFLSCEHGVGRPARTPET